MDLDSDGSVDNWHRYRDNRTPVEKNGAKLRANSIYLTSNLVFMIGITLVSACTPSPPVMEAQEFDSFLRNQGWIPLNVLTTSLEAGALISYPSGTADPGRIGKIANCVGDDRKLTTPSENTGVSIAFDRNLDVTARFFARFLPKIGAKSEFKLISKFLVTLSDVKSNFIDLIPIESWYEKNSSRLNQVCFGYFTRGNVSLVKDVLFAKLNLKFLDSTGAEIKLSAEALKILASGDLGINYKQQTELSVTSQKPVAIAYKLHGPLRMMPIGDIRLIDDKIRFTKGTSQKNARFELLGKASVSWTIKEPEIGFIVRPNSGITQPTSPYTIIEIHRTAADLPLNRHYPIEIPYQQGTKKLTIEVSIDERRVPYQKISEGSIGLQLLSKALAAFDAGEYSTAAISFEGVKKLDPKFAESGEYLRVAGTSNFKAFQANKNEPRALTNATSFFTAMSQRKPSGIVYYTLAAGSTSEDWSKIKTLKEAKRYWKIAPQAVKDEVKKVFNESLTAHLE